MIAEQQPNPWVVQAPKQAAVPDGSYLATFNGVEDFPLPQTGEPKWRFTWTVKNGEHATKIASTLTDRSISPTTLQGKLIAGLLGRTIVPGESVKAAVDACKGKTYLVMVQRGVKGGKSGVKICGLPPA